MTGIAATDAVGTAIVVALAIAIAIAVAIANAIALPLSLPLASVGTVTALIDELRMHGATIYD